MRSEEDIREDEDRARIARAKYLIAHGINPLGLSILKGGLK